MSDFAHQSNAPYDGSALIADPIHQYVSFTVPFSLPPGTMHVAGRFAHHLYPFLKKAVKEVPSANYVEEFLRITALVHDIGHGPFCHFFDDYYLHAFHASHEKLGQIIIR